MKLTKEKLTKLMQEYNASDLDELMDILPDLVLGDDYENELPVEEVVLSDCSLNYKESLGDRDVSCPFSI